MVKKKRGGRERRERKKGKDLRFRLLNSLSLPPSLPPSPFLLLFGPLPRRLLIDFELTSLITRVFTKMKH